MRVYLLKESDFQRLTSALDKAVCHGTPEQKTFVEENYRAFNYHIRGWINEVKRDDIKGEFE